MIIRSDFVSGMHLREIVKSDNENLRLWKNLNKNSFFLQTEITPEMQEKWFEGYEKNDEKILIAVEETAAGDNDIGCVAYRNIGEKRIDLFNIMRGKPSRGSASIKSAMQILMEYLIKHYAGHEYSAKVLRTNPALEWYRKCGFEVQMEMDCYVQVVYAGIAIKD